MTKKKDKLESRRKGVELVFDLMFWFLIIGAVAEIIQFASGDTSLTRVIIALVSVAIMFVGARLAHNGNIIAGPLGIIVGLLLTAFGGSIFVILGLLLVIDSIMFMIEIDKKGKK